MNPDGWLILGAKLDSKQLEKDLQKETTKLSKYEKEHDVLIKAKVKIEKSKAMQEYNQLKKSIEDSYSFKLNDPSNTPELTQKYITRQNEEIQKLNEAYSSQLDKIKDINSQLKANATHQVLIKDNIEKINTNLDKAKNVGNIKNSLSGISNETSNVIKKVAKWGLAIFSVRSAYMFVRQAVSTLSQYNEKIGTDIQYIRFALASSLQPLIEGIIKLVYKLLAYINYIAKAWFGVNLFANASAKAFQKVNKGVKDTNKSAKQLSKTLLGFDEMNILQKDGTTSIGGGGGGIATPSMDLSNMDVEIPDWIKWIADNGELIKNLIIGIGQAFLTWKLVQWASELGVFTGNVSALATILKVAGIVAIVIGISNAIQDVITFIGDPTWDNFLNIVGDLSLALVGLGAILVGINASNPFGWITLAVGGLGLLVSALAESSEANEELAIQTKSVAQAEEDLENAREERINASKKYAQAIKNEEKTLKELEEAEKKNKISGKELHDEILIGTKNYKDLSPAEREVYDAYLEHLSASEKLTKATEDMTMATWDEKQAHHELTGAVYNETQVYDEWFQTMIDGYRNGGIEAGEMASAMKTAMNEMSDTARKDFVNNLPDDIRDAFNHAFDNVRDATTGAKIDLEKTYMTFKDGMQYSYKELGDTTKQFKTDSQNVSKGFSTMWTNATKNIQGAIDKVKAFTKVLEKLPFGKTLSIKINSALKSSGMKTGGILKLASGAVINNPGRGVPLRSDVRGGEAGREGIIPLTDQQAMSQLGYEIGRNVVVAPTIPVYVGNRLVAKEVRRMDAEDNFAFNG